MFGRRRHVKPESRVQTTAVPLPASAQLSAASSEPPSTLAPLRAGLHPAPQSSSGLFSSSAAPPRHAHHITSLLPHFRSPSLAASNAAAAPASSNSSFAVRPRRAPSALLVSATAGLSSSPAVATSAPPPPSRASVVAPLLPPLVRSQSTHSAARALPKASSRTLKNEQQPADAPLLPDAQRETSGRRAGSVVMIRDVARRRSRAAIGDSGAETGQQETEERKEQQQEQLRAQSGSEESKQPEREQAKALPSVALVTADSGSSLLPRAGEPEPVLSSFPASASSAAASSPPLSPSPPPHPPLSLQASSTSVSSPSYSPSSLSSPSSASSFSPSRRRRKMRGVESAILEVQEMAAEGDIDAWVQADPLYASEEEADAEAEQLRAGSWLRVGAAVDANVAHRKTMEDAHRIIAAFHSRRRLPSPSSPSSFFAVYDGHGGSHASQYASRHLHRLFSKHLRSDAQDVRAAWQAAFAELGDVMARSRRFAACGTTAACVYLERRSSGSVVVHCANVGDARAVIVRLPSSSSASSSSSCLSTLHTAANAEECSRIAAAGGHILLHRVNGLLAVTRALGDTQMARAGVTPTPAVSETEVAEGEQALLVIATDGLWDVVAEDDVREQVSSSCRAGDSMAAVARRLCRAAVDRGSADNVSVIAVCISA